VFNRREKNNGNVNKCYFWYY